jgi:hypothetical protein
MPCVWSLKPTITVNRCLESWAFILWCAKSPNNQYTTACSCIKMAIGIRMKRCGGSRKPFDANLLRSRPGALAAPGSGDIATFSEGCRIICRRVCSHQRPKSRDLCDRTRNARALRHKEVPRSL